MKVFFWAKNQWQAVVLAILGVAFLIIYSSVYSGPTPKFTSPDETANYFFIQQFADRGTLQKIENSNLITGGLIAPRSVAVRGEKIVPGSFLGMILVFGLVAKIIGTKLILYLTPILSVVAVIFFYLLLKRIFLKSTAFISSLLLFVLPPFWYYSSRGMFHNAVFVDFLIIGLYFLISALTAVNDKKRWLTIILSGLAIGLSLITRTSEIMWVSSILISIVLIFRNKLRFSQWLIFVLCLAILFIPVLFYNNQLYGSALSFPYSPFSESENISGTLATQPALLMKIRQLIVPFGIDLYQSTMMSGSYLIQLFPWFSIGLLFIVVWLIRRVIIRTMIKFKLIKPGIQDQMTKAQVLYASLFVIIMVWLIVYYGAYTFYEYINKSQIILGSSYLRYWLPIFVFGLPLAVWGIEKLCSIFSWRHSHKFFIAGYVSLFVIFSVFIVLKDSLQGLGEVKKNIRNEQSVAKVVFQKTDVNSIIISGFADKVFFPERKVVVSLPAINGNMTQAATKLLRSGDVYLYYNPLDKHSSEVKNNLSQQGFRFEEIFKFEKDFTTLYCIYSS